MEDVSDETTVIDVHAIEEMAQSAPDHDPAPDYPPRTLFGGYRRDATERMLDETRERLSQAERERDGLRTRLAALEGELNGLRARQTSPFSSLGNAGQAVLDEARRAAQEETRRANERNEALLTEAARVKANATVEAERITAQADERLRRADEALDAARDRLASLLKTLG